MDEKSLHLHRYTSRFCVHQQYRHSDKNCSYKLTHDVNKDLYEARRNNKDA